MTRLFPIGLSCAVGLFALSALQPAAAADPSMEITTAATHAGMASAAPDMKMVQAHLHHVINCLVGPSGAGYDSTQADPCKGQGTGAIPDAGAAKAPALTGALDKTKMALAQPDMGLAKAEALEVQSMLNKAK